MANDLRPASLDATPGRQGARTQDYEEADRLFRGNLEHYCRKLVKIQTKTGAVVPFRWNRAQRELERILNEQQDRTGWARILILKARQLGISTYVSARFYRKTSMYAGQRTYILTHKDEGTAQLFGMAKTTHQNMAPDYRHDLLVANANELKFASINSGFRVGTAHAVEGVGRSLTLNNFHGSEVAFWRQGERHFVGAMNAVPDMPNTEIVLESTANGIGGIFHEQWTLAIKGESHFVPVFLPWFWGEDYQAPRPPDLRFSTEEMEYGLLHGLTPEQLTWMHFKVIAMGGIPGTITPEFRQEYPATAAEAFQTTGVESFIPPTLVIQARNWRAPDQSYAPLVVGLDLAYGGAGRTWFMDRQGRRAGGLINESMNTDDPTRVADRAAILLNTHPIDMMFVDVTGGGGGVVNILRRSGFEERVAGVNFGAEATEATKYLNKRAEMYGRIKAWLMDPGGAQIPDTDSIHAGLTSIGYHYDGNSRLQLEDKQKVVERAGISIDDADALALTFAKEIATKLPSEKAREEVDDFADRMDERYNRYTKRHSFLGA
jgi:hypothetical protein